MNRIDMSFCDGACVALDISTSPDGRTLTLTKRGGFGAWRDKGARQLAWMAGPTTNSENDRKIATIVAEWLSGGEDTPA